MACKECPLKVYAKGLCRNHYESKRRRTETGQLSPEERQPAIMGVLMDSFNNLVSDEEAVAKIDKLRFGVVL
jgi:hypothetical protein